MSAIIQLIALLNTFLFGWSRVVIGNYSELNPKDCGISRLSSEMDSSCFEWHKDTDSMLRGGKEVSIGDAPWIALLVIKFYYGKGELPIIITCSGSLIANQWILTAAHCITAGGNTSNTFIDIHLGYDFTTNDALSRKHRTTHHSDNNFFIHPKYKLITLENGSTPEAFYSQIRHDLALLKLSRKIDPIIDPIISGNNICLPEKSNDFTGKYEYAMIGGRGRPDGILKMAYFRLFDAKFPDNSSLASVAMMFKLDNQTLCKGDSGSPVWQYYMGRAVIVGVITSTRLAPNSSCGYGSQFYQDLADINHPFSVEFAVWVDLQIEWIKNVTNLN